jgi:hypothetical protein
MKPEDAIRDLSEHARRIGIRHADQTSAWENQLAAKAEVLAAVVEAAKPALDALCSPVAIRGRVGGATEPMPWRGLCLAGGRPDGRALYLNEHAALVEVDFTYVDGTRWESKWCPVTPRHVITEFELADLLDRLAEAMNAQLKGAAPERTEKLLARAAQLQAVALLVRGIR